MVAIFGGVKTKTPSWGVVGVGVGLFFLLKTNTPYRNRHLHTQTQSSAHTLDVKITSLFYWEGKLLCDYDELVKLQLRRRAMGEETTAV